MEDEKRLADLEERIAQHRRRVEELEGKDRVLAAESARRMLDEMLSSVAVLREDASAERKPRKGHIKTRKGHIRFEDDEGCAG
jgi:TolA-binding protein